MRWNRKRNGRRFSQVFLTDGSVLSRIAYEVRSRQGDVIVEIGPGKGSLTKHLLRKESYVIAVEIDSVLSSRLSEQFAEENRLKIINEDILKIDINDLIKDYIGIKDIWLAGNLPYDIGTAILMRFTPYRLMFKSMIFMLQREVAERIMSPPSNREYGFITVYTDFFYEKRKILNVSPKSFRPVPAVHSTVIELKGKETGSSPEFEQMFIEVLKTCFAHKRKTISNNIKTSRFFTDDRGKAEVILQKAGIQPMKRAEELDLESFRQLTFEILNLK